jgi:hypothetical protein
MVSLAEEEVSQEVRFQKWRMVCCPLRHMRMDENHLEWKEDAQVVDERFQPQETFVRFQYWMTCALMSS